MHVEDAKLYMPSDLSECNHCKYCLDSLATVEDRLRHAETTDSLESLRHHLRTCSFTNQFKIANVTGQIRNTRAQDTQNWINDKVHTAESQYHGARDALLKLRGRGLWEDNLKVLE